MLSDEGDSLKRQIASGEVCSGEMVQRPANAFMDVDTLIYDLNIHAAHLQKAI